MRPPRITRLLTAMSLVAGLTTLAGPARADTTVIRAGDDATAAQATPDTPAPAAAALLADGSPQLTAYLKFTVGELPAPVSRARLRLWVIDRSANGPELWTAGDFDEDTLTWNNRPPAQSRVFDFGDVSSGQFYELDVTSVVNGPGTYRFALVPDSTDGADFSSDEASSNRPELVVDTGVVVPPPPPPDGEPFQMGLFGDTGYDSTEARAFSATISDMSRLGMDMSAHVGDIWADGTSCPEWKYRSIRDELNRFDGPLLYTPGDNEWKDCTSTSGKLDLIRKTFFPTNQTLGQRPVGVTRQSWPRENARAVFHDVVMVSLNEPGSGGASGSMKDANVAWLRAAFDLAQSSGAPAVMVFMQDNPFKPSGGAVYNVLKERARAFGRPVTLVHGDTHSFHIDRPWADIPTFTRVEVFGRSDAGDWVRATVDPAGGDHVFSFTTERP